MADSVRLIRDRLMGVMEGQPWHGDSVMSIVQGVDPAKVFNRVSPELHSAIELLYHLNNWTSFAIDRLSDHPQRPISDVETNDWIVGDSNIHSWNDALQKFHALYEQLITSLDTLSDEKLAKTVEGRTYNIDYMLNGLTMHFVYHSGQLAYLNKFFATDEANRVFTVL